LCSRAPRMEIALEPTRGSGAGNVEMLADFCLGPAMSPCLVFEGTARAAALPFNAMTHCNNPPLGRENADASSGARIASGFAAV
jgi:hypothetical protein